MKLTFEEKKQVNSILNDYIHNPKALEMKNYIQHGNVTTYDHCRNVAFLSYWLNKRLRLKADERELLVGAFLHDFFLYDWHASDKNRSGLHGFSHAETARRNAVKYFEIEENIQKVIKCHMWPLNITEIPMSKEAIIVSLIDKYVSLVEIVK